MTSAFIAMPFDRGFDEVSAAIRSAAMHAEVDAIRGDDLLVPGPIMDQVQNQLGAADFLIAEISSPNPNVYYEVGLAHCVSKPTFLLARTEARGEIPFDLRHHRVLLYDDPQELQERLTESLEQVIRINEPGATPPGIDEYLRNIAPSAPEQLVNLQTYVDRVAEELGLMDARVVDKKFLPEHGYLIRLEAAFDEEAQFLIDQNGNIQRQARVNL